MSWFSLFFLSALLLTETLSRPILYSYDQKDDFRLQTAQRVIQSQVNVIMKAVKHKNKNMLFGLFTDDFADTEFTSRIFTDLQGAFMLCSSARYEASDRVKGTITIAAQRRISLPLDVHLVKVQKLMGKLESVVVSELKKSNEMGI